MNSAKPPRLAAWILQHFGPEFNSEALAGDLNEAFQQGRSKAWYWRQALAAIRWRRLIRPLLASGLLSWWIISPVMGHAPIVLGRPIVVTVITLAYFAGTVAPGIKRRRLRVLAGLLIAAIIGLDWHYKPDLSAYWMVLWVLAGNFVAERKAFERPSHPVTLRELLMGDPIAERKRMIARMEQTIMEETDPELRRAYAESIAALRRNLPPGTKAVQ